MNIGNVLLPNRLILAPMAGVTDLAFRAVCREQGAGLTVTEMVSAKALCYQDKKSKALLNLSADEHPCSAQIFGSQPDAMAAAAKIALEYSGADIIDLNMGCPTPKIVSNGDGCALMRDTGLASEIVAAVKDAVDVPVTVKMRKGWDKGSVNAPQLAAAVERAGADMIAVHGRTRTQMYSGEADWDAVRAVKDAVGVPVAVNGDVFSGESALHALRRSGADLVMVGRAAFGCPFIFSQIQAALDGREIPPLPPLSERMDTAARQFQLAIADKGEHIACLEARKHLAWYLRGVAFSGYYKEKIVKIAVPEDFYSIVRGIKRDLR